MDRILKQQISNRQTQNETKRKLRKELFAFDSRKCTSKKIFREKRQSSPKWLFKSHVRSRNAAAIPRIWITVFDRTTVCWQERLYCRFPRRYHCLGNGVSSFLFIFSDDLTWYVRGSGKIAKSYQPSSVSRKESNQTDARINFSSIPALDERISIVASLTGKFN